MSVSSTVDTAVLDGDGSWHLLNTRKNRTITKTFVLCDQNNGG